MSTVLGLAVTRDGIRAVAVRAGTIRWASEAPRAEGEPLAAGFVALLKTAPVRRWVRPRVSVAIGPSAVQTKRIMGLPPLTDSAALADLIKESAGRFFLRNGIPLVVGGVRPVAAGIAWSVAFDQPAIAEIEGACSAAGIRLRSIVPAVVALERALGDGCISWRDADAWVEVTITERRLAAVRRIAAPAEPVSPSAVVPPLGALGDDAWRFADAYGAAMTAADEPLALRSGSRLGRQPPRLRLLAAGSALAVSLVTALLTPGITLKVEAHRATTRLAALSRRRTEALVVERELRQVSSALIEVGEFDRGRRSPTQLLAQLARQLPAGSALVALRLDGVGGTAVLLAPRAAAAIARLERVSGMSAPEIVGPVTREPGRGGEEVERVTIRFRSLPGPGR